jgi:hypothetical protein
MGMSTMNNNGEQKAGRAEMLFAGFFFWLD